MEYQPNFTESYKRLQYAYQVADKMANLAGATITDIKLFGSTAIGAAREDSDVDLCVIPQDEYNYDQVTKQLEPLLMDPRFTRAHLPVHIFIFCNAELRDFRASKGFWGNFVRGVDEGISLIQSVQ